MPPRRVIWRWRSPDDAGALERRRRARARSGSGLPMPNGPRRPSSSASSSSIAPARPRRRRRAWRPRAAPAEASRRRLDRRCAQGAGRSARLDGEAGGGGVAAVAHEEVRRAGLSAGSRLKPADRWSAPSRRPTPIAVERDHQRRAARSDRPAWRRRCRPRRGASLRRRRRWPPAGARALGLGDRLGEHRAPGRRGARCWPLRGLRRRARGGGRVGRAGGRATSWASPRRPGALRRGPSLQPMSAEVRRHAEVEAGHARRARAGRGAGCGAARCSPW